MNTDTPTVTTPTTQDELRALLVDNLAREKRPILPIGGGTSLEHGSPPRERSIAVSTRGLEQVIEFAARDMTITVEAGISMARLDEVLRGEGLRLPIDIPQWERATLGGALAANASGPRRFGLGTFRDYVIGLAAMKADGQVFHSGGRVVKNVAGYDLCKLLVGSMGTLAIVTQVTLKLKPSPEASALVCAAFADVGAREAALAALLNSQTRPVVIDTLNRAAATAIEGRLGAGVPVGGPVLIVGYEGSQHETDWQTDTLLNELNAARPLGLQVLRDADAVPLWSALTEFAIAGDAGLHFEGQVLPSKIGPFEELASTLPVEIVVRAGDGTVYGTLPGLIEDAAAVEVVMARLAAFAKEVRGSFRITRGNIAVKSPMPNAEFPGAQELTRRLKATFDPENLLNPLAVLGVG